MKCYRALQLSLVKVMGMKEAVMSLVAIFVAINVCLRIFDGVMVFDGCSCVANWKDCRW